MFDAVLAKLGVLSPEQTKVKKPEQFDLYSISKTPKAFEQSEFDLKIYKSLLKSYSYLVKDLIIHKQLFSICSFSYCQQFFIFKLS